MFTGTLINTIKKTALKDDYVTGAMVAGGLLVIASLILLTPVKAFVLKPFQNSADSEKQQTKAGSSEGRGMFRLGNVLLSLGTKKEFIDSDIDLEFDREALGNETHQPASNKEAAQSYLERKEGRIKDALLTNGSVFTSAKVKGDRGMERFKEQLVDSINNQLSKKQDIVTNIYFRRFIVVPPEDSNS